MVTRTNKYTEPTLINEIEKETRTLLNNRRPLKIDELLRFLTVNIWMGLNRKPELTEICGIVLPWFEAILYFFSISDHELGTISRLVHILKVSETLYSQIIIIYWWNYDTLSGQICFYPYIPKERPNYRLKLFKLCVVDGNTDVVKE